jgi:hypothetical protein
VVEADAPLVTDADVLMNLWASDRLEDILRAGRLTGLVCPRVEGEALWVQGDAPGSREPVELTRLFEAGILQRVTPDDREVATMVELAMRVDDGEAEAIAIATSRGLALATDDRKATKVAFGLGLDVLDTPGLVRAWSDAASPADVASVLSRIESRARYAPRVDHPLARWWAGAIGVLGDA